MEAQRIRVGVAATLAPWAAEIKYVLRTLLRIAGSPCEFVWVRRADTGTSAAEPIDLYYGPRSQPVRAAVSIPASGRAFTVAPFMEPRRLETAREIPFLDFGDEAPRAAEQPAANGSNGVPALHFPSDIVFACYWLLTGAREPHYRRDRWDNLHLDGAFFLQHAMAELPLVSVYGDRLRRHFAALGYAALPLPWTAARPAPAFAFSHDVDYPQMIRWIECVRLLATRGGASLPAVKAVLRGTSDFWRFADWMEFERQLDARPAFYFMARRGSPWQYAAGRPDAFYDINSPAFHALFGSLREHGCEVGLHASYEAYRSTDQLRREKDSLEQAAGALVDGIRHHFWHLDPAAPHATLRRQEEAGFVYDSSMAFEYYPGFRRGICHPFRVFDPDERREINVVELPPAWMDDHFDRRLRHNRIADPDAYARRLVEVARTTGGIVVVDYHVRGMNQDFFPRYGRWLMQFVRDHLAAATFRSPGELARMYVAYEGKLAALSRDLTAEGRPLEVRAAADVAVAGATVDSRASVHEMGRASAVGLLQPGEEEHWDAYVAAHPLGGVYHTLAWRTVTEQGLGHRPYYLRAVDPDGRFAGVLPLFLVRGLSGSRLVSVPMRDRGGVLATDTAAASGLVCEAVRLTRQLGCTYLELRSAETMPAEVVGKYRLQCTRQWITTRIDLAPGKQRIWQALDRDFTRWAIKKAEREGVRIDVDNTRAGMGTFYDLFVRTRSSMGIPPFPQKLFEAMWQHLVAAGKAALFLVWKDGCPINGMVTLLSKDTFILGYAAPQREWRHHHPSDCVFWYTIAWAADQGFRFYDMGADSPQQLGLLRFKKKWGGVHQPMSYYYSLNGARALPNFDSSSATYAALRRAWAQLPLPVSKHLGAWVTRQLS